MTLTIDKFNQMRSDVEKLRRKADKAEGALEQTKSILKEEFDCDSIEEAKALAEKMRKETDKLESRFEKAKSAFDDNWGDKLNA